MRASRPRVRSVTWPRDPSGGRRRYSSSHSSAAAISRDTRTSRPAPIDHSLKMRAELNAGSEGATTARRAAGAKFDMSAKVDTIADDSAVTDVSSRRSTSCQYVGSNRESARIPPCWINRERGRHQAAESRTHIAERYSSGHTSGSPLTSLLCNEARRARSADAESRRVVGFDQEPHELVADPVVTLDVAVHPDRVGLHLNDTPAVGERAPVAMLARGGCGSSRRAPARRRLSVDPDPRGSQRRQRRPHRSPPSAPWKSRCCRACTEFRRAGPRTAPNTRRMLWTRLAAARHATTPPEALL